MRKDLTIAPAKISLELHGRRYSIEGLPWDIGGDELVQTFRGLLVAAGFSPAMLDDEFGYWEWKKREDIDKDYSA